MSDFTYPLRSVNADNYLLATQQGQTVLSVDALQNKNYAYFYYLFSNPVTPLVVEEDIITYSKLAMHREAVVFLMNGAVKLEIADRHFIKLPTTFQFTPGGEPAVARWSISGTYTAGQQGTQDIDSFIPDRAYDYAEEFEGGTSQAPITADTVRENWARRVAFLLA